LRAGLAGGCEIAAEERLLGMTHDEHGVAGKVIVCDWCGGVKRGAESDGEERGAEGASNVLVHSNIVAESEMSLCEFLVYL